MNRSVATDAVVGTSYDSESFVWTVNSSGSVTVAWSSIANQTNADEDAVSLSLSATDSASHSLIFSAFNLPSGGGKGDRQTGTFMIDARPDLE